MLVGHSYGGAIITVAGTEPKVKVLVHVAGLQPDVGETAGEVAPPKPPADKHLAPSKDGFVFVCARALFWAVSSADSHGRICTIGPLQNVEVNHGEQS